MTSETIKGANPGPGYKKYPDHSVNMSPFAGRVEVNADGKLVTASDHAILLTESGYSPVYYLPRSDVDFDLLEEVELSTHCPFKGHARYWQLIGGDKPVLWGYDDPYDEVRSLSRYVAFYEDRITVGVTAAA